MGIYQNLLKGQEKIVVVGLGYVGLPLAVAFDKKVKVIGFDINQEKIEAYKQGMDLTQEVGQERLIKSKIHFTSDPEDIKEAKVIIIAVPTPIKEDKTPNLTPVIEASKLVAKHVSKGSIVVYESTVYPGVTEEVCIPLLEEGSGLSAGKDFKVGYSPERINPGDRVHRLETIKKIVSGIDKEALEEIAKIYELIITAGIHKVSSIKVAEAAKVAENSQRDINIAFMNELAMVFERMEIDTKEVIEAMNTKWNALGFYPGLVGGHCIGVDPYYFVYQAEKLGYHSQIILSGRKINDGMSEFITQAIIKNLILTEKVVKKAKVAVLGVTFKEDCKDIRNSKVYDIVQQLKAYGIEPRIADPVVDQEEAKALYGENFVKEEAIQEVDMLIVAVGHEAFKKWTIKDFEKKFKSLPKEQLTLMDIKGIYDKQTIQKEGYRYWRL